MAITLRGQRHPNDSVATIPGAADPASDFYVPIEHRNAYAAIDAKTEAKLIHQLRGNGRNPSGILRGFHGGGRIDHGRKGESGEIVRKDGRTITIPIVDDADLPFALHAMKLRYVQMTAGARQLEQARADSNKRLYTCRCEIEEEPGLGGVGVQYRRLPGGIEIKSCKTCYEVAAAAAVAQLAAQRTPAGRTRSEVAAELLEEAQR